MNAKVAALCATLATSAFVYANGALVHAAHGQPASTGQGTPMPDPGLWPNGGDVTRGLLAVFVVFGLLGLLAWLGKRGFLGGLPRQGKSHVKVEGAVPLGERRSLVIVSVEGRRLLIGLTPMQISLVTELTAVKEPFDDTLARSLSSPATPTSL